METTAYDSSVRIGMKENQECTNGDYCLRQHTTNLNLDLKLIKWLNYFQVFCQEGAYEASKIMLSDDPFKPTVYDKVLFDTFQDWLGQRMFLSKPVAPNHCSGDHKCYPRKSDLRSKVGYFFKNCKLDLYF